jgi:hypothetical protein
VLEAVRTKAPRLVIFDLDSSKMRPMDRHGRDESRPALRDVPTLGFVSHVHATSSRRRGRPASIRCWRDRRSSTGSGRSCSPTSLEAEAPVASASR